LLEKEDQIRTKGEEWGRKADTVREQLTDEIEKLTADKEKKAEELRILRERDQQEQQEKENRER